MNTKTSTFWMTGVMIGFFLAAASFAFGATEVAFTNRELEAAFTLVRPELNKIEVNGQTGVYTPAPAIRFFGVDEQKFEIDFKNLFLDIAKVEFDGLRAKTPLIQFQNGALVIIVPIEDKNKVIHSRVGTISIKNVTVTANLGWITRSNGTQDLRVVHSRLDGSISGTGVLKPAFVLDRVKKLIVNSMNRELGKILSKPIVQENIDRGLLAWAKFYTGVEFHSITPGSIQFFNVDSVNGIRFSAE